MERSPRASSRKKKQDPPEARPEEDRPDIPRAARPEEEVEALRRENAELRRGEAGRRRTEEELRYLSNLVETVSDAIIATDTELRIQSWNKAAERVYGWRADEVVGKKGPEILRTTFPDGYAREALTRALFETGRWQGELIQQTKDGRTITVEATSLALKDEAGSVVGGVSVSRDITERKGVEEALQESESILRSFFDSAGVMRGIVEVIADDDIRHVMANATAAAHVGLTPEAMTDKRGSELGESREEMRKLVDNCKRSRITRQPVRFELHGVQGAREAWLSATVSYLGTPLHGYPRFAYVVQDLTERIRAEEERERLLLQVRVSAEELKESYEMLQTTAVDLEMLNEELLQQQDELGRINQSLRESEEQYRTLVEQSLQGLVMVQDSRIVFANQRAADLGGYPVDELLALAPDQAAELLDPKDRALLLDRMRGRLAGEAEPPRYEVRLIRKDKSVAWVEFFVSPAKYKGRPALQVSFIDITERREAEIALQRYALELREHADRLKRSNDDLERFAFISSHDLQEPLRTMVTFTQLLERRYKDRLDADADEYIRYIVNAGKRMQSLINDLLEYSRVNTRGGDLRQTDTAAVVEEVLEEYHAPIAEHGVTVTHDPLPMVQADAAQLRQVFRNLIGNAIKFKRPDVPPVIHIAAEPLDGMVRFSVSDNGIGIEPQYFDRIFVIFQRLHGPEKYDGTGIGLALVKRIVERHGGTIGVDSAPGKGSTFLFTLPASSAMTNRP